MDVPSSKELNGESEIPDPDPYQIAPYNKKNPFKQS